MLETKGMDAIASLGLDRPEFHDPAVLALEDQCEFEDLSGPQIKEELARLEEETIARGQSYRWPGQEFLATPRMGKLMSLGELLRILHRASPGFWVADRGVSGMVGLFHDGTYVCGVQPGVMPEYSQLRLDRWGIPTKEKYRGWRTVLLNVVQKKVLSEERVHKLFGRPEGPAASAYLARLADFRRLQ